MANVSVSNTTGLYIGSGAASVLNNAQQLLGLLSNNGGVTFSLDPATSNTKVEAFSSAGGNYGNSNVALFLPNYTGAISSMTGNLTTTANVQGAFILGNGSQLTGIVAASTYSNTNVAAFLPTYTGAMTSMTGAVTTTANVSGAFILGNGSQLTGLGATYSNTNVAAFLPTYTGAISSMTGNLTTTANVQGAFILGNGSQLTGLPATYSNTNVAAFLPTYTGAISSMTGNVTTTANVQGAFILGNGSQLTGLAATYSNTNVAAFLPTYTGAISSMTGNVTTTANIQGAFILGNGSQLTGLPATYSNTNVAAFLPTYTGAITSMTGNLTTTANIQGGNIITSGASGNIAGANYISANFFVGNGSLLTGISAGSTYGNTNVAAFLPTYTGALTSMTGNVTTTANVQGAFLLGNGSQLTGITTNYSNANVTAFLPTYTGAISSMTGNVTTTANIQGGNIITSGSSGNIAGANYISANFFVGNGSLLTGISGASTYGNTNVAAFLPTYTGALTSLTGNVTTTANVQGAFILGNGSALTGVITNYSNTNVAAFLPTYTGAITSMTGNVTTTANVQAAFFVGNGSLLTGVTSTLANVAYELQAQSPTPAGNIMFDGGGNMNLRTTAAGGGNATVNIYSGLSVIGSNNVARFDGGATATNLTVGFISSNANITTSANAQAAFFIGNGSQLTGISGGGSSYGDSNVAVFLPNYTGAITSMTGNVTTTANVQAAYFIGNGSQLTGISGGGTPGGASTYIQYNNAGAFDGSANLIYEPADGNITVGNLVFNKNYNRILQTNAFDTTVQSATQNATGQFIVGDGWNGNVTSPSFNNNQFVDGAFVVVNKSYTKTDNGRRTSGLGVQTFVNVTANIANTGTRIAGIINAPRIGGNITVSAINAGTFLGMNNNLNVGGGNSTFATLGNANLRVATGTLSSVSPQIGSFVGNAFGYLSNLEGTANGQFLDRMTNYSMLSGSNFTTPGAFYGYHMPNSSSYAGVAINSGVRQASQYYFLYNEDDVAQVRLGSLRRYTEYRANITSSGGNLTIDKTVAQVQYLTPTETVNNVSFTNFVTNANDGANNDTQADTVTLIVQQGATPYSITMPTGSEYLYAGNVRIVGNTANSVTMISTTATQNVSGGTQLFLITISPEFV